MSRPGDSQARKQRGMTFNIMKPDRSGLLLPVSACAGRTDEQRQSDIKLVLDILL